MININGEEWIILIASPNHPALQQPNGSYTLGVCDDNIKTIYIVDNLTPYYFKKVLSHELTHACMFSYNIILTLEQEELLADLVATYGQEIVQITNLLFGRLKTCDKNKKTGTCY